MSNRINVKISTATIISVLEERVTDHRAVIKAYEAELTVHEKLVKTWEATVVKTMTKRVGQHQMWSPQLKYRSYNDSMELTLLTSVKDLPEEPKKPDYVSLGKLEDEIKTMEQAIRLLQLALNSGQELVSTSSYGSISQFL
jgi:TPP-dependent pyruvate/acetoin dehydrogenase alpha subunit